MEKPQIWVFLYQRGGVLHDVALELLGKALPKLPRCKVKLQITPAFFLNPSLSPFRGAHAGGTASYLATQETFREALEKFRYDLVSENIQSLDKFLRIADIVRIFP